MDESRFNHLKAELKTLSSGCWKDSPVCPDLGLPNMDDDQLAEFLNFLRPVLIEYGSVEWGNVVNALLYLNVDQRILDAIAERFPGMDRALEEGTEDDTSLYRRDRLDAISNIRYFPVAAGVSADDNKEETAAPEEVPAESDVNGRTRRYFDVWEKIEAEYESRPEPTPVLVETVKAINMAQRLLKMAEMNIHNVTIRDAKKKRKTARILYDDYGDFCGTSGEQTLKRRVRDAIFGTDRIIDILVNMTCGENKDWIRHTTYQRGNEWMRDSSFYNRPYERPTNARAKKALAKIPKEIEKAEKYIKKVSGESEADNK